MIAMSIRPLLLAFVVGASACVIPAQPQSTGAPAPAGGAAPTAATGPRCETIFECYGTCTTLDDACVSGCERGADPTTVANTRALTACVLSYQCADAACMQTSCGAELTSCSSTAGGADTVATVTTDGAVEPTVATGGVHGVVYVGIGFDVGGLDSYGSNKIAYRVLLDDGRAFRKIPDTGLAGVDDAVVRELGDMAGTYAWSGDTVELQFGTYSESFSLRDDGSITGGPGTFFPADPLDGAVLDGFYSVRQSPSGFTFSTDGRFRSDRDSWLMLDDRHGAQVILPDGTGAYQIASNTLTLAYDDGQRLELPIVTQYAADLPTPAGILISSWQYTRK
jgi:hypothetical protein